MTSSAIEFCVGLPSFWSPNPPAEWPRMANAAEQEEYHAISMSDHVVFPETITSSYPGGEFPSFVDESTHAFDLFQVLSYLAGETDEINLVTQICIVPLRHPVLLSKMILSLDAMSDGRFELGVGAGWLREEFEILDVPFEERGGRTDEFLELFERVCREDVLSFAGEYHSFQETGFYPRPPAEGGPPIWVGGNSGAAIRRAVDFGDGWTPMRIGPDDLPAHRDRLEAACEDRGRADVPNICLGVSARLDPDSEREDGLPLVGSADRIIRNLEAYIDGGVSRLIIGFRGQGPDERIEQLERFNREIRPSFE